MDTIYNIKLNKNEESPLYIQLADKISDLIETGALMSGSKLPPIRRMAEHFGVNNVTIVSAYKYLENKKAVYSLRGSGTYVSDILPKEFEAPVIKTRVEDREPFLFNIKNAINFASSSSNPDLFPVEQFKVHFNTVLERDKGDAFSYQESQGYLPLRKSICDYLTDFNIKTAPDKIQIISGAQQGIDIISKSLLNIGDVVFVEKPTYLGAVGAFLSRGANVVEIDMENDGMDMNMLESMLKVYKPKFIYMMSYFQTPTCISYSHDKKYKLLNLASKYDTYILEEDNQSEFIYNKEQPIPIKSLDYKNRVIYIKSFSKILMPGLRLGFMVLPQKILTSVLNAKYTTDISTSGFIQRAFELFLKNGDYKDHVRSMINIYKTRYEITDKAVKSFLKPYVNYAPPLGGINVWLEIKNKNIDISILSQKLIGENVIIAPGDLFCSSGSAIPFIKLSFANTDAAYISLGIKKIGETIKSLS